MFGVSYELTEEVVVHHLMFVLKGEFNDCKHEWMMLI